MDVFPNSPNLQDLPFSAYRAYQATVERADHALPHGDSRRFAGADRRAAAIIEGEDAVQQIGDACLAGDGYIETTMPVVMRFAERSDLSAVREFGRRVVVPFYESLINLEYGEAIWRQYWGSDDQEDAITQRRVMLAEAGGRIVGVTEIGVYEGEPVMWKLYVSPDERRRGIGRTLVEGVCDAVTGEGVSSLLVEHPAENRDAGRFYDSLGFAVAWLDKGDGPGATTVWRRKKL